MKPYYRVRVFAFIALIASLTTSYATSVESDVHLSPDAFSNTLVVAGETLTKTLVISNTGTGELEFSFCPPVLEEDDGLILHYTFDNDVGTTVVDQSGNGYDGQVLNAHSYVDGVEGKGLRVVGNSATYGTSGGHVKLPTMDISEIAKNGLTISAWIKEETSWGESYFTVGKVYFGHYGEKLYYQVGDDPVHVPFDNSVKNTFAHYVLSYENGMFRGYRNGQLVVEHADEIMADSSLDHRTALGRHWINNGANTATRFVGVFDDVRIYNRALSDDEITELYSIGEEDGLIAHYPFNGNAADETGNGYDGAVIGATLTADRFGNPDSAYEFDGVNDYIDLGTMGGFKTVSMWVKQSISTDTDVYFGHRDFKVFAYGSNNGILLLHDTTSGPKALASTIFMNDYIDQWVHVVAISDGLDSKIFFNGNSVALDPRNLSAVTDSIANIGRRQDGLLYFHGQLDDVRIYNRVLSEDEVFELYAEADAEGNGLVAEFSFNGSSEDSSGYANHALNNGAVLTEDRYGNQNSALLLDGNDYLTIADSPSLYIGTNDFAYAMWVKTSFSNRQMLCQRREGPDAGAYYIRLNDPKGKTTFITYDKAQAAIFNGQSEVSVSDGEWHLIVCQRNDEVMQTFIDGQLVAEESGAVRDIINSAGVLYIGCQYYNGSLINYLNGSIDDVRIYNRALTVSEVASLFAEDAGDGLAAHYPLNGNADDDSGNGLVGTINGAMPTTDRFGNANGAYTFDGIDDYIEAGNSLGTAKTAFTAAAWVRSDAAAYQVFLSKKASGEWQAGQWQLHLGPGGGAVFAYADMNGNSNLKQIVSPQKDLEDGAWHHICGIMGNDGSKLYIDGVLVAEDSSVNLVAQFDAGIHIGDRAYSAGRQYFNGDIDDVRIYSRALAADEILELYSESEGDGLIAHYPFNGSAADEAGNGYDGAVFGAALTADRFGNPDSAYMFDGINDYIDLGTMGGFKTVSMWVKQSVSTDTDVYFGHRDFKVFAYGSNNGILLLHDTTSGPKALASTIFMNDHVDEWVHVVAISDGLDSKIYFNGESVALDPRNLSAVTDSIANIGRRQDGLLYFHGSIDDIYIYDHVLSDEDILELYTEGVMSECILPDWLALEPKTGTVLPGESAEVSVTFAATNLVAGDYGSHVLNLFSTGSAEPLGSVPVSMWVTPRTPILVSEPGCTEGRVNELSWSGQDGPVEYWVEGKALRHGPRKGGAHRSKWLNPRNNWWLKDCFNFVPPVWEQNSGWIAATNHTFTDLRLFKKYEYRVKASVLTEIGRLESDWSEPEVSVQIRHMRNGHKICIPDWWKNKHFGRHGRHCADHEDADGDGHCNLHEYITGNDPHDHRSSFKVRNKKVPDQNGYTLEWESVPGRVYSVYWCESLGEEFQLLQGGIRYPQSNFVDRAYNETQGGFYKVEVELDE